MQILLVYVIIYLLIYVDSQEVSSNNNKEPHRKLSTLEKDLEGEKADNPLVFNALFKDLKEQWIKTMFDFVNQYIYLFQCHINHNQIYMKI